MYTKMGDPLVVSSQNVRLCENENVDVWNIDASTVAGIYEEAGSILKQYVSDPYSNLVTQQIDMGDHLEYNGVLYVHVL